MTVVIRRYEDRDLPLIFPLYATVFGTHDMERFKSRWRWQFLDAPGRHPEGLWGWVAEEDGKILAYIGSYASRLKVLDQEITINVEADLIADPDARRRDPTMAIRLLRAVVDSPDHLLANAFATYTEPHEKLRNWLQHVQLHVMPICMRPYNLTTKLKSLVAKRRIPQPFSADPVVRFAAGTSNLALKAINAVSAPARDPKIELRRIEQAGNEFDDLWHRSKSQFPIIAVRDRAFVQWRFLDDPGYENVLFGAYSKGSLVGYCAVQDSDVRGMRKGRILDLFCDPAEHSTASSLLREGLTYLENRNADVITSSGLHPELRKIVRRSFYYAPESADIPSLVRWAGEPDLLESIYNKANWHLAYADDGAMEP